MMKKFPTKTHTQLLSVSGAFLCLGICLPFLISHTSFPKESHSPQSQVPYCVTSPEVPQQVSFAGQIIDLMRYDHHERMDRELMSFTYMHASTLLAIKRANRYFPIIEPILKQNGVPDDFKYLAVIESHLNPLAKSPAGAAGMWQFMPVTGREFGLEVNSNVDERYHLEKATEAACRYFKQAYGKYNDWLCVAASYNAGQGRISSEKRIQKTEKAMELWLVEETSRYLFRLLAAKTVLSAPQQYGFLLKKEQLYPPIPYQEVTLTAGIDTLVNFAIKQGISYAQLKEANPWLRERSLKNKNGKVYKLKIPKQEGMFYNPKKTVPHHKYWVID